MSTSTWMRMASAVVDQPLADAILLAGKEFPGRVARMLGDGVQDDQLVVDPHGESAVHGEQEKP
ncbi:hypothetical protein U5801_04305 [Lamprobacter modestohalophilus]|nr:hypothetical protein [Lamprobacter modestohalophilus]MEA1049033.1 hypothetical protein [Lamprobacter modestohalophilus]